MLPRRAVRPNPQRGGHQARLRALRQVPQQPTVSFSSRPTTSCCA
jgi:hypothetical protein